MVRENNRASEAPDQKGSWPAAVLTLGLTAIVALLARGLMTVVGAEISHWYRLTIGVAVVGLLVAWRTLRALPRSCAGALAVVFLTLMAVLGAPWTSRDRFLADFHRVRIGMTESEVELVLAEYLKGTGIANIPGVKTIHDGADVYRNDARGGSLRPAGCQVYRHSNDGAWNADWGTICYRSGRVVTRTFSPD